MTNAPRPAKPYPIAQIETNILRHDESDAARIVSAAVTLAALPGVVSGDARELALSRLRDMSTRHPRAAEVLHAMVQYIESYQS